MLKTLRFYLLYLDQVVLCYGVFAAIILVGSLLAGDLNGLMGTYATMMPTFGLMFGGIFSASFDSYLNVALSMGARRAHCFWAMEFCGAVSAVIMPVLTVLVYPVIGRLPDAMETLEEFTLSDWILIVLATLAVTQLGLLAGRAQNAKTKSLAMVGVMVFAMVLMVAVTILGMPVASELTVLVWPGWLNGLVAALPWILGGITLVLGALVYHKFRKAVVTV